MPQVRDLFFDEFYSELERVVASISRREEEASVSKLSGEVLGCWNPYLPDAEDRSGVLVSVDGGVQISHFAYGDFVAVGRACALIHRPGEERAVDRRVKIYIEDVYDDRDRGYIPSYVRMIAEYEVARAAAERVLGDGEEPIVLLDGSLYLSRFPYAVHEYQHHPELLAGLFSSMAGLHILGRDKGFPVVAVAKDSMVFYLYMDLLRQGAARSGNLHLTSLLDGVSSPFDLRLKMFDWQLDDRANVEPLMDVRPACDLALVDESTSGEGFTTPLLLAPSIYYGRGERTPDLYRRIRNTVEPESAERAVSALRAFFGIPGVAVTYFRPMNGVRPLRVDVSASTLGYDKPWEDRKRNEFMGGDLDLSLLKGVLNHLGFWFCNEVEYNLPLHHADMLARFDRALYESKYEPLIIRRLSDAGLDVTGRRRTLREVGA